ncbi:MAG TPA: hypothetical protein VL990_14555 [Acidobacteriaceae bacterium]|nr:hypothetical protein [Acidobacteriaceae bacterium]
MISGRELQSISVSPLSATAQGQPVQFTATGHWSAAPLIVTPQSASWGACANGLSTTAVTVSSTGLAQCAGGAKGTFSVFAFDPPLGAGVSCNAITACGGGCTISGTAQLTCP